MCICAYSLEYHYLLSGIMGGSYTDVQFNHILDILILYKQCVPEKEVYLNESSLKDAVTYFQTTGLFESLQGKSISD